MSRFYEYTPWAAVSAALFRFLRQPSRPNAPRLTTYWRMGSDYHNGLRLGLIPIVRFGSFADAHETVIRSIDRSRQLIAAI